jgi:hypothetical protein
MRGPVTPPASARMSAGSDVRMTPPPAASAVATTIASIVAATPVMPASRFSFAAEWAIAILTGATSILFRT